MVEPRLARETPVDGDMSDMPKLEPLADNERRGLNWALGSILLAIALLAIGVLLPDSPLRDPNPALAFHESITSFGAPLMRSIVPLIFILFLIPGAVYGYAAGTIEGHRDLITGMREAIRHVTSADGRLLFGRA